MLYQKVLRRRNNMKIYNEESYLSLYNIVSSSIGIVIYEVNNISVKLNFFTSLSYCSNFETVHDPPVNLSIPFSYNSLSFFFLCFFHTVHLITNMHISTSCNLFSVISVHVYTINQGVNTFPQKPWSVIESYRIFLESFR